MQCKLYLFHFPLACTNQLIPSLILKRIAMTVVYLLKVSLIQFVLIFDSLNYLRKYNKVSSDAAISIHFSKLHLIKVHLKETITFLSNGKVSRSFAELCKKPFEFLQQQQQKCRAGVQVSTRRLILYTESSLPFNSIDFVLLNLSTSVSRQRCTYSYISFCKDGFHTFYKRVWLHKAFAHIYI